MATALIAGPVWAGHSPASTPTGTIPTHPKAVVAAKKKPGKGTLSIRLSGSGAYTVTGKHFRKAGTASKSFTVKPGAYTVKAPGGSVTPGKAKVRKGKTTRVTVTFQTVPDTPTPTDPQPTENPPAQTPAPTHTPTPTPTPTPSTPPPGNGGEVKRVSTDPSNSQLDGDTYGVWSRDGSQILLTSWATNLSPTATSGRGDVFAKSLVTGAVQQIDTDDTGSQGYFNSSGLGWSPDDSKVLFFSQTQPPIIFPNPPPLPRFDIFAKTLASGVIQLVNESGDGQPGNAPSLSGSWSPRRHSGPAEFKRIEPSVRRHQQRLRSVRQDLVHWRNPARQYWPERQ